jgi:ankyrin repeat protein
MWASDIRREIALATAEGDRRLKTAALLCRATFEPVPAACHVRSDTRGIATMTGTLSQDEINQFIIKCHFDLPAVQQTLTAHPEIVAAHSSLPGSENETPLGAAAHVGNRAIAEYLLAHGAPLEFCAAVALDMGDYVRRLVDSNPALANAGGAHNIPALVHATIAGNADLARYLVERGAVAGGTTGGHALHGAIHAGDADLAVWLISLGADTTTRDFRGKTPLESATEAGRDEIVNLLRG